jgi:hypothetical protein
MSFTENLYLKRQLQQLQEENLKLNKILMQINEGFADAPDKPMSTMWWWFRREPGHVPKPHEDDHFRDIILHNLAVTNAGKPSEDLIARGREVVERARSAGHTGIVLTRDGFISHYHTQMLPGDEEHLTTIPIDRTTKVTTKDGVHTYPHTVHDPFYGHR